MGSQYRSCLIISSVSELASRELFSIIDMAVCCTLRVSDQHSAPVYLIIIGDTFSKTKVNISVNKMSTRYSQFYQTQYYMQRGIKTMIFLEKKMRLQHDCNENKNNMY